MTEDFFKANYPTVWERFHSADQPTADLYELLAFAYSEGGHRREFWERRRLVTECKNLLADLQREMKGVPAAAFDPENEANVGSCVPYIAKMAGILPAVIDDLEVGNLREN